MTAAEIKAYLLADITPEAEDIIYFYPISRQNLS